jgi:hypothetical protein
VARGRCEKHGRIVVRRGVPVSQPQQETSGDYGYDLAHEAAGGGTKPEGDEHRPHTVVHPGGTSDRSEDYGYDEAHGF